jgi:hypothetical protein
LYKEHGIPTSVKKLQMVLGNSARNATRNWQGFRFHIT